MPVSGEQLTCDFRVEQVVGAEVGAGVGERLLRAEHLRAQPIHQVLDRRQTLRTDITVNPQIDRASRIPADSAGPSPPSDTEDADAHGH